MKILDYSYLILILILHQAVDILCDTNLPGLVRGVIGYPIGLPCNITPADPGDSPHLILWYKTIFGTPIYSLDARNGIENAKHWADKTIFTNRNDFYIKKTKDSMIAYLNISEARPSDEGPYRCRVDFWKAATRNIKITVDLAEEPRSVQIYNGKEKGLQGFISTRINSTIRLTCKAYGGDPIPTLRWKVGEDSIDYPQTIQGDDSVSSTLILGDLEIEDSGKAIKCEAHNNDLFPAPSASVKMEIIVAPVQVQVSRSVSSFQVGSKFNLTCQVLGSNPPPATSIWVAGQKLENVFEQESTDGKIFTIIAEYTPEKEHNGEYISCQAKNKYFPKIEDQWKISVVYKPITSIKIKYPSLSLNGNKISVNMKQKIILGCEAEANPTPFTYSWKHQTKDSSTILATGSSTLVLDNLDLDKTGAYYCIAENLQGHGDSSPIHLNINYPPSCTETTNVQLYTSVHESFDLSCEMDANPRNLTFRWQLFSIFDTNRRPVEIQKTQFTQHETKSVLTLTPRTPGDFGKVICSAHNLAGEGKSCEYVIKQRSNLPEVKSCEVSAEWDSISVVCVTESNGVTNIEYHAELFDTGLGETSRIESKIPRFRFMPVRPNAVYTVNVSVVQMNKNNNKIAQKIVKFSQIISLTDRTSRNKNRSKDETSLLEEKMMHKILPLIGVSGLLVIVFLVIMIILSLIKRSRDMMDKSSTHIGFNQGLDQPDMLTSDDRFKCSLHRVQSLDRMNQLTVHGYSPDMKHSILTASKYHTLPVKSISVVSVLTNQSSDTSCATVKRVTFAKGTLSNSSSSESSAENSSTDSVMTVQERHPELL